jgi:excinuclease ABC subunit A
MSNISNQSTSNLEQAIAQKDIVVQGAKMRNLKNIDVVFPKNKFIVVTGVSGSGKSSLTMDTLFAEGQRRYVESLSSYARQFLMRMDKPNVDFIHNVCPAIAIEQKVTTRTPRSTVGSMTEIQDYLRLLFARIGKTYSPISGLQVKKDEVADIVDFIVKQNTKTRVYIAAPFKLWAGRTLVEEAEILLQKGFSRLLLLTDDNIQLHDIEDVIADANLQTDLEGSISKLMLLVDRVVVKEKWEDEELHRIADSIQTAVYESEGSCFIVTHQNEAIHAHFFNNKFELDGIVFETPSPNLFSYNNPYGACPKCEGFGKILGIDIDLVIPNVSKSVFEDAVVCWRGEKMSEWKEEFIRREGAKGFPIHKPINKLDPKDYKTLRAWIDNFFSMVEDNLYKIQYRVLQARYRGKTDCPECDGTRLRKEVRYVKINDKDIAQLSSMPIDNLYQWFQQIELSEYEQIIAKRILIEIEQRLQTLLDVGLQYLTLDRLANTLSGGESQRIQLTRFLGSNLTDSLYILDEPSIGLHPRDTHRLISVLKRLKDLNNTVIVVEHDELMMEAADHIIDMGPLAAHLGGEVIAEGNYNAIIHNPQSLTGKYLSKQLKVHTDRKIQLKKHYDSICITGCSQHNLRGIDVSFPLNAFCVITGVSGSGKTTLIKGTLYPALMRHLGLGSDKPGAYDQLSGDLDKIENIELVDQNPIGKSSRSNPVTYIKAYDDIRALYASQKLAKMRGLDTKHFSFNSDGGRCDECKGDGTIVVSMQFLADVTLECDACKGKKFKEEVLEVTYNGKNINDVLEMSVDEAATFFEDKKNIVNKLKALQDVGLGYIKLGQSSSTLSGGEAQRVKLASFLIKSNTKKKTLFIFDEPTTGLHFHDITKLLNTFYALIEGGHSLIVIEHNTEVIKNAQWLIDIGPEGGENGGTLIYSGPVEGIKNVNDSITKNFI